MGNGTGIGRVRGLGSAKAGTHHWILARVTAVGNLLLMLWFMFSLATMPAYDYDTLTIWLSAPFVAVALMLLTVSVFWHLRLGLQVIVEDYVHDHGTKFGVLILLNFYAIGGAALSLFAIAKIAFAGGAN